MSAVIELGSAQPAQAMPIFLLGAAHAPWRRLAQALHDRWPGASTCELASDDTKAGLDRLVHTHPDGRFIVFVHHPASALTQALCAGARAQDVLGEWCDSARALLLHSHRRPTAWIFVDAAEAASGPRCLMQSLARWDARFGELGEPEPPAVEEPDVVYRALAQAAVKANAGAQRLFDELHASCIELDGVPPVDANEFPDVDSALAGYRALRAERDTLDAQAQAAQEERDASGLRLREIEAALTQAVRQRDALDTTSRQLRVDLEAAVARERSLAGELEQARHEGDLQLLQLHQAQESIELVHAMLHDVERGLVSPHGGPGALVRFGSAHVAGLRDEAPHREVDLSLQELDIGGRSLPTLRMRLVEHHGRPGLTLFSTGSLPEPLSAWQPSGEEDGVAYQLLVPEDRPSRQVLETLGQSDWVTVRALADLALRLAVAPQHRLPARWRGVAARLCTQLADIPARLRYDRVEVSPSTPPSAEVHLTLVNAGFGPRSLGDIALRWQPLTADLRWIVPSGTHEPPFARWPAGLDGLPRPEVVLPVARALTWRDRRRAWGGMPLMERDLLLGLLDALSGAATTLADDSLPPRMARRQLAEAAQQIRGEARQALFLSRVHAALGKLRRPRAA